MKNILVGSVYGPTPRNLEWFHLQNKFLKATVPTFDHISYMNAAHPKPFRRLSTEIVGHCANPEHKSNIAHADALNCLLDVFRKRQKDYQFFLILDSDAFPIRKDWFSTLTERMNNWGHRKHQHKRILATAIRHENLEHRLHASVLFCRKEALEHLHFEIAPTLTDVAGGHERDVWMGDYFQQPANRKLVLPLLRSNKVNVHPVWSGVYYDMFYHHGGGSRAAKGRAHIYHDHYANRPNHPARFSDLMRDPCEYISELAGWSPKLYVKAEEIR